jgi:hypothetical protein
MVQKFERIWMVIFYCINDWMDGAARVLKNRPWKVAACPPGWRGQSAPLARTVWPPGTDSPAPSADSAVPNRKLHFLSLCCGVINYSPVDISHIYCSGLGGLKKKFVGRFKSKRPRADDADYNPTTDSEAQSSAGGSISMDIEDVPHAHPDYPIDITGWTYPKRRFSMVEYYSRRTVNQYDLPSDTNIRFFHTHL